MFSNIPILGRFIDLAYTMFLVILLSVIVGLILAFPVFWLWNYVFGGIYQITVLQAWALNVLTGILFKSGSNGKK